MSSSFGTKHIPEIVRGNNSAIQKLSERYFARMVTLARQNLRGVSRLVADEEDVANSALDTFCRRARDGHFPNLKDRDGLWKLLMTITIRKALNLKAYEDAAKRKAALSRLESELSGEACEGPFLSENVLSREPSPDEAAELADQLEHLLSALAADEKRYILRTIATLRLAGHTVEEIAEQIDSSRSSVENRMQMIRQIWGPMDEV